MNEQPLKHAQWTSRAAFILAASGSAIGLGNIWKFPYLAGENGGGAFVLVYVLCVLGIGIPIMIAETMLGRLGRLSPINTMIKLAKNPLWHSIGWMGIIAGFIILSYYSVIAGWAMAYFFKINSALFEHITAESADRMFNEFKASSDYLLIWHTLFMAATYAIVSSGVNQGLERSTRFMMPALLLMLLIIDVYAFSSDGFSKGFAFLFNPDFSKLSSSGVLAAMGQAFFSLGLGMGSIMIYGAYLPTNVAIGQASCLVALLDTLVALMAGLAIFPIVFANGLEPSMGAGLIFQTLPIAFGQMPGGSWIGMLFFLLVFFAAITSAIALIEPAIAWLSEHFNLSREKASLYSLIPCWLLGFGTVFSFNIGADFHIAGRNFFEFIDFLTADIMLPVSGVLIAVFSGWVLDKKISEKELDLKEKYRFWLLAICYAAPTGVAIVFLDAFF